jgi:hypothetical protein
MIEFNSQTFFGTCLTLILIIFSTIPITSYSCDGFSVARNDTSLNVSNSSKVLVDITFDSLFINNDKNLFGKGLWNFSVNINDKPIELLVNEKVNEGQTVKFDGKNISLVMPISDTLYLFSQPYYIQKAGKIGILDWISEYNQINNFGNGSHIAITDDGKEDTVNINLVIYKYPAIINKDPDYVLRYHIKATPLSNNLVN